MKKIFTIIAAGMLASGSSAFAVINPNDIVRGECKATPQMVAELEQLQELASDDAYASSAEGRKRVMRRTYSDGEYLYDLTIANSKIPVTDWWELYAKGDVNHENRITFEEMPMYVATYDLKCYTLSSDHRLVNQALCYVSWPTYATWDLKNGKDNFDIVPLDVIGTRTAEAFCNTFAYFDATDMNVTYLVDEASGYVLAYSIWSNASKLGKQICNENSARFAAPTTIKKCSFVINDVDLEEETINSSNDFYFEYGPSYSNTGSMSCNYDGEATFQGFNSHKYIYEIGEIHVFNAGLADPALIAGRDNPYMVEWEPQQKFWLYGSSKDNHLNCIKDSGAFNPSDFSFGWNDDVPQELRNNNRYRSFYGLMYAPANTEDPTGKYVFEDAKLVTETISGVEYDYYDVKPMDWVVIPRGVSDEDWSSLEGFKVIWNSYYQYLRYPAFLGIGFEEGFVMEGYDIYGNYIYANTDKDIIYHYDPKDISKKITIPSVGMLKSSVKSVASDSSIKVHPVNGGIVVTSASDTAVEVYSLAGCKVAQANCKAGSSVSVDLANGIYVVRTVDGAVKVMVK